MSTSSSYTWPDGSILTKEGVRQAVLDAQLGFLGSLRESLETQDVEMLWSALEKHFSKTASKAQAESIVRVVSIKAMIATAMEVVGMGR